MKNRDVTKSGRRSLELTSVLLQEMKKVAPSSARRSQSPSQNSYQAELRRRQYEYQQQLRAQQQVRARPLLQPSPPSLLVCAWLQNKQATT